MKKKNKTTKTIIGPSCSFSATEKLSPTGLTWKEIQLKRDKNQEEFLKRHGFEVTPENMYNMGLAYTSKKIDDVEVEEIKNIYNPILVSEYKKMNSYHFKFSESRVTQTEKYDLENNINTYKSSFLVFNIRASNNTHDAISEIGIVYVKEGEIYDMDFFTIKSPAHTAYKTYIDSDNLKEVWRYIEPYFEKVDFITAFNLSSHKSNLEKSLEIYGISLPTKKYFCAYNFAKSFLSKVSSHILENVCYALNIELDQKQPYYLARAIATAEIVLKTEAIAKMSIAEYDITKPSKNESLKNFFKSQTEDVDISDLEFIEAPISLSGKNIIITGDFDSHDRKKLSDTIAQMGGIIKTSMSSKINVAIIGSAPGPSKIEKLKELLITNSEIYLINEPVLNQIIQIYEK